MRPITKNNKKTITHNSVYTKIINDLELEYIDESDSLLYGIKNLFLPKNKMPVDFQQGQDLPDSDVINDLYFFQIDREYRELDIVPNSIQMKFFETTISSSEEDIFLSDDGNGNILYGNIMVGNIFYNSGVIVIYNNVQIDGLLLFDDIISNYKLQFIFKYNIQFFEDFFELEISPKDYTYSFNPTYDEEKPIFFSKIYLMNDNNDLIATAVLSRPQEIYGKIKVIIDDIRKI